MKIIKCAVREKRVILILGGALVIASILGFSFQKAGAGLPVSILVPIGLLPYIIVSISFMYSAFRNEI